MTAGTRQSQEWRLKSHFETSERSPDLKHEDERQPFQFQIHTYEMELSNNKLSCVTTLLKN